MLNFKYYLILLLLLPINAFAQDSYFEGRTNVGDIPFDSSTDNPDFKLIDENNILPYNTRCGFLIDRERYRVLKYFLDNYKSKTVTGATGYITIRFIVNHNGQTDRFRVYEMDNEYNPIEFPKDITDSLLTLTKELDGWITTLDRPLNRYKYKEILNDSVKMYAYDYYQYILFKIKDGQIETILP